MVSNDTTFSKSENVTKKSSILHQHRVIALDHLGTFFDEHEKDKSNLDCNQPEKWPHREWNMGCDQGRVHDVTVDDIIVRQHDGEIETPIATVHLDVLADAQHFPI